MGRAGLYALLLVASALLAAALEAVGLPAGLLLGPMLVAIAFAVRGAGLDVSGPLFIAAQALIGLLIAPSMNLSVFTEAMHKPAVFLGTTLATLDAALLIGGLLARWRVLPGSVAV